MVTAPTAKQFRTIVNPIGPKEMSTMPAGCMAGTIIPPAILSIKAMFNSRRLGERPDAEPCLGYQRSRRHVRYEIT